MEAAFRAQIENPSDALANFATPGAPEQFFWGARNRRSRLRAGLVLPKLSKPPTGFGWALLVLRETGAAKGPREKRYNVLRFLLGPGWSCFGLLG